MAEAIPSPSWWCVGLHHIGLTVGNLEQSVRFYRDRLGLLLIRRRTADADYVGQQTGFPGVRLEVGSLRVTPDGSVSLELAQYLTQGRPSGEVPTNQAGTSHLCLQVDDIQRAFEDLQRHGVRFKSAPVAITAGPNAGGFAVYLFDPDGYTVELFQPPQPSSGSAGNPEPKLSSSIDDEG
jgi:catechol 2,3-dioxygenase-like lactoylglutathione lyase family enzyme